ncbi:gamma-glutamyl phosphate reductase [Pontibacillus halophilus JSM 076056 = DSM 19796]|uniref:Gamma-glutamyl phosphate reductase n=1 Tax=Pontibacillus halophilus JSM 076056 = DSM 19796 TaxID=1385510 RepID=A0A0A5GD40_9BACI|nr:glutamate-5-semialdehyde dehydrogenase [Pontibacillus halophilus]KGX91131.1 gamma-glutamyl phosphate reductase [Pontibacillus halophilus JSM 076056 = DSM 19796]
MSILEERIDIEAQAIKAKKAAKNLSIATTREKDDALHTMAKTLEERLSTILEANEEDLRNGEEKGYEAAFMDRLKLTEARVRDFANGLREVAELEDPTDVTKSDWTLENGLNAKEMTVPLGVIGMIYEARPNVTVDATGLALKSGNAIVLKGGSSAINTNRVLVEMMREALQSTTIPAETIQFIDSTDREATQQLFTMKEHIDVLIPRGGGALINAVVEQATVPVLETGVGNCHIYVDKEADLNKSLSILVNAKTDRPAVCNAVETLLVHKEWLEQNHQQLKETLDENGIIPHGDATLQQYWPDTALATEEEWANEYLSKHIAIKTVDDVMDAIDHIETYGTKHSESIVTENKDTAETFLKLVDAAAVYHNASTRFTDGGALGFGAEIGISTQKLHARGPMGLPALTTIKYVMTGDGQIR